MDRVRIFLNTRYDREPPVLLEDWGEREEKSGLLGFLGQS